MIDSLRCENFRCFRDTGTLKLAPLTLIFGENNSGKSSILQALHLPALTLQSEDPGVCLKLFHQDYDYGSFTDLVFQHDEDAQFTLIFGKSVNAEVFRGRKTKLEKIDAKLQLTYGYLRRRKEIYLRQFILEDSNGPRLQISQTKYADISKIWMREHKGESKYLSRLFERKGFFFYPRYDPFVTQVRLERHYGKESGAKVLEEMWMDAQLRSSFASSFLNLDLLGPLRIPARRTYQYWGEIPGRIGVTGNQAFQKYSALLRRGKREDRQKVGSINEALYQLGFINKLEARQIGAMHYEFWTQHSESLLRANLADTGFGASQVLPVIISLYTSQDGATLLYEQPEIHLHPAAQAELGSVFARACSSEKRIVIETHSENLILRIQTEIAKGKLKPRDVIIYYVHPTKEGHQVREIPLDEKGQFLTEWPKGFFEESYQESLKLSKARHEG